MNDPSVNEAFDGFCECPIFCGVDKEFLRTNIKNQILDLRFTSGGEIRLCGENGKKRRALGYIVSGRAYAEKTDGKSRVMLRAFEEGDIFGAASLFSDEAGQSSVIAATDCRALMLPAETILHLLSYDSGFMLSYVSFLCGRVQFLYSRIAGLTSGSAEKRLARYICGLPRGQDGCVAVPVSFRSLSETLDISRASLYRSLDELEAGGLIVKNGKSIIILEPHKLENISHGI